MPANFVDTDAYERLMGRWSRALNRVFVPWLGVRKDAAWLDVGCGTGALAQTLLDIAWPGAVTGVDPSPEFIAEARKRIPAVRFEVASAERLPFPDASFDAAAASLCLQYSADPAAAASELRRVLRPGGVAGATVWAPGGMEALARMQELAQGPPRQPSPVASPEALNRLFVDSGFRDVAVQPLTIPTVFADFDDYWQPFLGGQGSSGAFVMGLEPEAREELRARLQATLQPGRDGTIRLQATALAVRGRT